MISYDRYIKRYVDRYYSWVIGYPDEGMPSVYRRNELNSTSDRPKRYFREQGKSGIFEGLDKGKRICYDTESLFLNKVVIFSYKCDTIM
jgi:hypothetical protein